MNNTSADSSISTEGDVVGDVAAEIIVLVKGDDGVYSAIVTEETLSIQRAKEAIRRFLRGEQP